MKNYEEWWESHRDTITDGTHEWALSETAWKAALEWVMKKARVMDTEQETVGECFRLLELDMLVGKELRDE